MRRPPLGSRVKSHCLAVDVYGCTTRKPHRLLVRSPDGSTANIVAVCLPYERLLAGVYVSRSVAAA